MLDASVEEYAEHVVVDAVEGMRVNDALLDGSH